MMPVISIRNGQGWMGVGVELEMPRAKKKTPEKIIAPASVSYKPAVRDRVCMNGMPERKGVILNVGPQQSEVKWDDRSVQILINEWLQPVGNT